MEEKIKLFISNQKLFIINTKFNFDNINNND